MGEQWVCLWNEEQKCDHVEMLEDYIKDSLNMVMQGKPQKWVLVYVGTSRGASKFGSEIDSIRGRK